MDIFRTCVDSINKKMVIAKLNYDKCITKFSYKYKFYFPIPSVVAASSCIISILFI